MSTKGQAMIEYIIISSAIIITLSIYLNIYSKSNIFKKLNNKIDSSLNEIIKTNFNKILTVRYEVEYNK